MSPADRIAIRVKSQPLHKTATGIVIGKHERRIICANPEPCDPPDLSCDGLVFCGLPITWSPHETQLSFIIDVP